jgi:hypothetical protein
MNKDIAGKNIIRAVKICPIILVALFLFDILSPIQFTNYLILTYLKALILFIFLLSIVILFFTTKLHEKSIYNFILKLIITVTVTLISQFVLFFILIIFFGFVRNDSKIYNHISDETRTIERMNYDGGAWDSSSDYKVVEVKYLPILFRYVKSIDTNKINKSEWIRIGNKF